MVRVVIWFLDHLTLKSTPSVNGVWIITFVSHLHIWLTKFKPSLMFLKLPILTSNNVIWLNFFAILFDERQHVVKASTAGYVPVCYEVINFFIEPQNLLLMGLICKLKGLYLIITVCDGLLMFFLYFVCKLQPNMRNQHNSTFLQQCLLESFAFGCWLENNSSYIPSQLIYRSSFCESLGQLTVVPTVGATAN